MAKIRIKKSALKKIKQWGIIVLIVAVLVTVVVVLVKNHTPKERPPKGERRGEQVDEPHVPKVMYGIVYDDYELVTDEVKSGQTLSHLLGQFGVSGAMVDRIDKESRPVFNMRSIRAGQPYTAFLETADSTRVLRHFVYEKNVTDYVVVSIKGDSVAITQDSKEITIVRRKETAEIRSSLWNAMVANDLPVALSCELEDIYGWSVDFFGLQEGDVFTVIFDEKYIDTTRVGIGQVWGSQFKHNNKVYYAIPTRVEGKVQYWDENGNSMRKQFLKAPLKYTRISSKFTNSRMHPIYKVRRPHHGVDYAAPSGTPVVAIADGTVTHKYWDSKGGGNTLKIRHSNGYSSGYLHLKGYAKGVNVGTRVSQGQLIAYVGSTGASTGPHLDFRVWKNNTPVDPLKLPSGSMEPIPAKYKPQFDSIKVHIMAELEGEVPDSVKVTKL